MTFGNRSTTIGWQKGGGGEEGSEGGGELKRLVCRLDGWTRADTSERADETATFAPEGERATERRREKEETPTKMFCDTSRSINNSTDRGRDGHSEGKGRRRRRSACLVPEQQVLILSGGLDLDLLSESLCFTQFLEIWHKTSRSSPPPSLPF